MRVENLPLFEFRFDVNADELLEARRRMVYFALGKRSGIVGSSLLLLIGMVPVPISLVVYLTSEPRDPGAFAGMGYTLLVPLILLANYFPLKKRVRLLLAAAQNNVLQLDDGFVRFGVGTAQFCRPWNDFVAMEETERVFLLLTLEGYLVIPKRIVPADSLQIFRWVAHGRTLKQGPMKGFPIEVSAAKAD